MLKVRIEEEAKDARKQVGTVAGRSVALVLDAKE